MFNLFINDMFYTTIDGVIANHTDDTTVWNRNDDLAVLQRVSQVDADTTIRWFLDNNMSGNPDKFHCMLLGHKDPMAAFSITGSGHHIETLKFVKTLGITVDNQLKFGTHISNLCNKASRQTNALQRLSHFLNENQRSSLYQSFVCANLNFSTIVWMFCRKLNCKKLEKLQQRDLFA